MESFKNRLNQEESNYVDQWMRRLARTGSDRQSGMDGPGDPLERTGQEEMPRKGRFGNALARFGKPENGLGNAGHEQRDVTERIPGALKRNRSAGLIGGAIGIITIMIIVLSSLKLIKIKRNRRATYYFDNGIEEVNVSRRIKKGQKSKLRLRDELRKLNDKILHPPRFEVSSIAQGGADGQYMW